VRVGTFNELLVLFFSSAFHIVEGIPNHHVDLVCVLGVGFILGTGHHVVFAEAVDAERAEGVTA